MNIASHTPTHSRSLRGAGLNARAFPAIDPARVRAGVRSLNHSCLARKIVFVNLLPTLVMGLGLMVWLPTPDAPVVSGEGSIAIQQGAGPRARAHPHAAGAGAARAPESTAAAHDTRQIAPPMDRLETGRASASDRGGVGAPMIAPLVFALIVSIAASLYLAATIALPLSRLAHTIKTGRGAAHPPRTGRQPAQVPTALRARRDEIGDLARGLKNLVAALDRQIDLNERFAADMAHELKNPLTSLGSAAGTLRATRTDERRKRLLDVIDHDVQRLDRLLCDISGASRLDSALARENLTPFDLNAMLKTMCDHQGEIARQKEIDFIADLPHEAIFVRGSQAHLAQVVVNLMVNALSFCETGDAIRVWMRQKENQVLVGVEDTGPGIPDSAIGKIFERFYSQRPARQFGNHSGLGLSISKQIVEAHNGAICAENIHPTDIDITSEPMGARFVIGLPV